MNLARAADTDLAEVVALMNRAYRGSVGWASEGGYLTGHRIRLDDLREELAAKPQMQLLVWREEGRLLGCVSIEPQGDAWLLGMLTVEPQIQDRQLGRRLLEAAEARVREAGGSRVRMTVIWLRDKLIEWYGRRGYRPTGETKPFPYEAGDRWGTPTRDDLYFVVLEKQLA